ncbi:hypothetical protein ECG_03195 [Echinococcus granulosus]|nr:hypothetical protein ECG_03195 [Echinococcus granulosus]
MEIALDEDLPYECAWTGSQDSVCIRVRPLLQPQQSIQLGEYTTSFRDAILCLQISAEVESSQRNVCLEVRASLKSVAKKDLSLAYRLLRSLRTARRKLKLALLKQGVGSKAARATIQIINRLVKVRHDMKMTQWDYEGITAVDQKGFIGVSGCRCEVPGNVEEEIDAYITFKAKQQNLAWEEQKLVRSLFDRTKKLSSWSNASLLAYKQHPSLSRILQGLNFLPRNMTDLETSLHLVPRYLTEEYTSEISKRSSNALERAVLLKLEEIVVRRRPKDFYFLNKSGCVKDWLNRLPGKSQSSNVSASDVCKSGTLRHPSLLSFAHGEVEVDHKMGLSE